MEVRERVVAGQQTEHHDGSHRQCGGVLEVCELEVVVVTKYRTHTYAVAVSVWGKWYCILLAAPPPSPPPPNSMRTCSPAPRAAWCFSTIRNSGRRRAAGEAFAGDDSSTVHSRAPSRRIARADGTGPAALAFDQPHLLQTADDTEWNHGVEAGRRGNFHNSYMCAQAAYYLPFVRICCQTAFFLERAREQNKPTPVP